MLVHRLRSRLDVERRSDARTSFGYSAKNRGRCGIRVRDATQVKFESGQTGGESWRTSVFQAPHVTRAQPAAHRHTQHVATACGADLSHEGRMPAICAPIGKRDQFCRFFVRDIMYVRAADTTFRDVHQISSVLPQMREN